ncbi:hypothetical protein G7046_g2673 [Stylonectria norvegica]|nr:hypothetical protein G7046_g2673 [Stylonectria norvegica]
MKAIVINDFHANLGHIQVSDISIPQPGPGDVLIKVAQGKHQNNKSIMRPPFTLGLEFAGIVVSAPPTSMFEIGDGVFGDCSGSYAEYIVLSEESSSIQKLPPSWNFIDSAGLGATLSVSYGALVFRGGIKAGETVLVHSAAGGLGVMATQIAVAMGCRVLGTAGSPEKCEYARDFGANSCFNYSQGAWWEQILEATEGRGVDVVFDPVGLVDLSLKCITHRGRILVVGFAGREGQMEKIAMNRVLLKQVTLMGYRYGESIRRCPEERQRIWRELQPLLDAGMIRPAVSKCYSKLESVPQALMDLSQRKIAGKAVIQVSQAKEDDARSML